MRKSFERASFCRKRVEVIPDEEGEMYVPSLAGGSFLPSRLMGSCLTDESMSFTCEESRRADEWFRGTIL